MTLSTHAIVGAAAASFAPAHPLTAFSFAFASHFLIDAIPHWDYHLASHRYQGDDVMTADMPFSWAFLGDLVKIGFDFILGFVFSFLIFGFLVSMPPALIIIGVVGGMLPDFLQFAYMKFRHEPLTSLYRFHAWFHTKKRLVGRPILGIILQGGLVVFVSLIARAFFA